MTGGVGARRRNVRDLPGRLRRSPPLPPGSGYLITASNMPAVHPPPVPDRLGQFGLIGLGYIEYSIVLQQGVEFLLVVGDSGRQDEVPRADRS